MLHPLPSTGTLAARGTDPDIGATAGPHCVPAALIAAAEHLGRALPGLGSRTSAHELVDAADRLASVLPIISTRMRAEFGDCYPEHLRVAMCDLRRCESLAADVGAACLSVVSGRPSGLDELGGMLERWADSARLLASWLTEEA